MPGVTLGALPRWFGEALEPGGLAGSWLCGSLAGRPRAGLALLVWNMGSVPVAGSGSVRMRRVNRCKVSRAVPGAWEAPSSRQLLLLLVVDSSRPECVGSFKSLSVLVPFSCCNKLPRTQATGVY